MKRIMFFVLAVFSVFSAGCASDFLTVSARGGPAVLANLINDQNQAIKTTPGGFAYRNQDAKLGALVNQDNGVSKDVEIFVQGEGNIWSPYNGSAEVYTPGWIKIYEEGKWKKVKLASRWFPVEELKAIHFDTPYMQAVTLRIRSNGKIEEIYFETSGRRETNNSYERINVLFIKLPLNQYRFNIYSYTGELIFKRVEGQPYTRNLWINNDPTDYRISNIWVGWILYL